MFHTTYVMNLMVKNYCKCVGVSDCDTNVNRHDDFIFLLLNKLEIIGNVLEYLLKLSLYY